MQLHEPPRVALQVLGVLRVDGVRFALRGRLGEERRDEELCEPIQRFAEVLAAESFSQSSLLKTGRPKSRLKLCLFSAAKYSFMISFKSFARFTAVFFSAETCIVMSSLKY